jgi:limonene 1,2-monooxygenase
VSRLRFGIFLAPFHPAGENPTTALQRDLQLVEHLDDLGYDEAWIGEHHSAGSEIIASPEVFIAAAAERTRRIRLGTGVISLSYHNPLWVAERIVLLDHLTRGRVMLGVGPGSLPTDSAMIGLNPTDTRELLDENLDIVMRLLRSDEPVTVTTRTHRLIDARLHLRPYSDPLFDIAVAAVASPTGPRLAGRHGVGLLSIGATLSKEGFDALAHHWNVMEERSGTFGTTVDRAAWRLVGLMHVAETREQAYRDVEYGIEQWFRYFQRVAAFPQMVVDGGNVREMIEFVNEAGIGAIGTADDAAAQVQRLVGQSGGFGAMLLLAHEWANPQATRRSFELIAQHVMPRFQGQAQATLDAKERAAATRSDHAEQQVAAVAHMTEKYQKELAERP